MSSNSLIIAPGVVPKGSIAVSASNPAVWYPFHKTATEAADASGSPANNLVIPELLGLGPQAVLQGTTPATGWGTGCYVPNGTDAVATTASSAHLDNVFNLADLDNGKMILVGLEVQVVNASATSQYFFFFNRDAATAGFGGWGISYATTDAFSLLVRGVGAASSNNIAFGVNIGDTHTAPVKCLMTLWKEGTGIRMEMRQSGTVLPGNIGTNVLDVTGLTLLSTGSDGLTLMGRRTSAAAPTNNVLGGAASGAQINNFFVQKRAVFDPYISDRAYADMVTRPREFPASLRG